ncbi:MAG: hypothetical protein F2667_00715 [Actinobacteria bacterium]|uniref:Unannotated protein n=1 Tax=freshwater metagenome TaxID=449393 RepID=A0A6J6NH78_9ZZZZ|nr:hypothetical protein [Actinomycetota bacterium]
MTDAPDPRDARAEQAFRDALAREADRLEPAPLDLSPRRRRWLVPAAAAAVLVLVAGLGLSAVVGGDDEPGPVAADGDTAPDLDVRDVRSVSYRDVTVAVPGDWDSASAPGSDWCSSAEPGGPNPFATAPYVAYDATNTAVAMIACTAEVPPAPFDQVPAEFWAPHLSFADLRSQSSEALVDGTATYRGWTLTTRTVGTVQLRLLTDAATAGDIEPILDSARVVERTPEGCDTTSPAQSVEFVRPPAFDITEVQEVSSIAVCQYLRQGTDAPGLMGSALLEGDEAAAVLDGIRSAPVGGGPDTPETCLDTQSGTEAIVLRLTSPDAGERDVYVYYDWCFGNGFDDGTERRELTRDSCPLIFTDRVILHGGSSAPFARCD